MTIYEMMMVAATAVGAAVGQWATRASVRKVMRAELAPVLDSHERRITGLERHSGIPGPVVPVTWADGSA